MDRDRSAEELIAAEALILMRYGFNAGTVQPAPPSASPPRVEALAAVPAASPSAASLPRADGSAESPAAMPVAAPAAEPVAAPAAAEAANNQGAPTWDEIDIPKVKEALAEPNGLPTEAQLLLAFPVRRAVKMLKATRKFSAKNPENLVAAIGQCVGDMAPEPCTKCANGNGPFTGGCVLPPADAELKHKSCFNCLYQWQYKKCSHN